MRSKRSNAPPETARARGFATRVGESGAAPEPHRPRPDAERYVHTVRDLTFPIGDVAVGIGSRSLACESPKGTGGDWGFEKWFAFATLGQIS